MYASHIRPSLYVRLCVSCMCASYVCIYMCALYVCLICVHLHVCLVCVPYMCALNVCIAYPSMSVSVCVQYACTYMCALYVCLICVHLHVCPVCVPYMCALNVLHRVSVKKMHGQKKKGKKPCNLSPPICLVLFCGGGGVFPHPAAHASP